MPRYRMFYYVEIEQEGKNEQDAHRRAMNEGWYDMTWQDLENRKGQFVKEILLRTEKIRD